MSITDEGISSESSEEQRPWNIVINSLIGLFVYTTEM